MSATSPGKAVCMTEFSWGCTNVKEESKAKINMLSGKCEYNQNDLCTKHDPAEISSIPYYKSIFSMSQIFPFPIIE